MHHFSATFLVFRPAFHHTRDTFSRCRIRRLHLHLRIIYLFYCAFHSKMFFGGDPFEHFAQQGHGGGGGSRRSARADVDTTKLYEILGVRLSLTRNERTIEATVRHCFHW